MRPLVTVLVFLVMVGSIPAAAAVPAVDSSPSAVADMLLGMDQDSFNELKGSGNRLVFGDWFGVAANARYAFTAGPDPVIETVSLAFGDGTSWKDLVGKVSERLGAGTEAPSPGPRMVWVRNGLRFDLRDAVGHRGMVVTREPGTTSIASQGYRDVTGDGVKDIVRLTGRDTSPPSDHFADLRAVIIRTSDARVTELPLPTGVRKGLAPRLWLGDLNADKLSDVAVIVGSPDGGLSYAMLTGGKGKPMALGNPGGLHLQGRFTDRYGIELKTEESGKRYRMDLSERRGDYEALGLYDKGILKEAKAISAGPVGSLQFVDADGDGTFGLSMIQPIRGAGPADVIGLASSVWSLQGSVWRLISDKVQAVSLRM